MIQFIRRIRQKLLKEGKLKKYIVYALGEVLLVMVGILLALQVNNWNETKKERKKEIKLISQLQADLKYNLEEIKGQYDRVLLRSVAKDSILSYLPNAEIYKEELKLYLHHIQLTGIIDFQ